MTTKNICSIKELEKHITLTDTERKQITKVIEKHPMKITPYYLSLIDPKDPKDPIRKMAIPSFKELDTSGSFDTSGEKQNTKLPGLQHKYDQTALILSTNRCSMYCRHCFRKRLVGLSKDEILENFDNAIKYIKTHKEINNVLVSGGDPFVLSSNIISKFINKLSSIDHLNFIRFGTRIPVTNPDRINDFSLLYALKTSSKIVYITTQFNHPKELTQLSRIAIQNLRDTGAIVNNQTVLMKDVNDDPKVLANLMNGLVNAGVNPYYVFQCRPVKHVKNNFQISIYKGYQIIEEAKSLLDGYSKRFKYIMSHRTGKIEVLGIDERHMYFKYHQAKKNKNMGAFFKKKINKTATWLDDFKD